MQFIKLQERITKIMKKLIIQRQNYEFHGIRRIPCKNSENHEKFNYSITEKRNSKKSQNSTPDSCESLTFIYYTPALRKSLNS